MTDALIESDNPAEVPPDAAPTGDGVVADVDAGTDEAVAGRRGAAWVGQLIDWIKARTFAEWVTFAIVSICVLFVFWQFKPGYLFSDTTPTGGDMSAHVWGPAYLRDHLLPKGRLTGWTPDWYAGFPAFQFYMVIPFLAIALLSYVIPYGVAFKLVAISGCLALPVACYLFGRLNRLPFPVPPLLAVGGMYFLFDRSYSIYGGNIASTLAGEFCFSISLSLAIVFLGVVGAGLRTGKYRGWAALLFALTALCHLIPMFFALAGMILWFVVRPGLKQLRYLLTIAPVGFLAMAFWLGPFYLRGGYVNDMGWDKVTTFWAYLVTRDLADSTLINKPDLRILLVGAALGTVLALVLRLRSAVFIALMGATMAGGFVLLGLTSVPVIGSRLWNARLLPFYYLSVYLMAAIGIALAFRLLARLFAGANDKPLERVMAAGGAIAVSIWILLLVAAPMKSIPGGKVGADGVYRYGIGPLQFEEKNPSYIADWIKWNFDGLESWERPVVGQDAAGNDVLGPPTYDRSYPEFYRLVQTMKQIGADHGCGRAMWEYEDQHNRFGSPMEPMMLPFFTDSCIGSMEGLYFEASATTPYHFIDSIELSKQGSGAQRDLPYAAFPNPSQADFDEGIGHLQMLGVRYYLAIDDFTKGRAAANPSLQKLADSDDWSVYLVANSDLVVPLKNQPAVLTGQATTGHAWQNTSVCWYVNPAAWDVPLVDRGPDEWQRVAQTVTPDPAATPQENCGLGAKADPSGWSWFNTAGGPEKRPLPSIEVTNAQATSDTISFDVSQIGVPVLVKTSYFPNWKVSGADVISRATPNLMVVVPTATHVELSYGWTGVDIFSYLLTAIGIMLLVILFRLPPMELKTPARFWWPAERPDLVEAAAPAPADTDTFGPPLPPGFAEPPDRPGPPDEEAAGEGSVPPDPVPIDEVIDPVADPVIDPLVDRPVDQAGEPDRTDRESPAQDPGEPPSSAALSDTEGMAEREGPSLEADPPDRTAHS